MEEYTVSEDESRAAFENWVQSLELGVKFSRWGRRGEGSFVDKAWMGQYCNYSVELAWQAWQKSAKTNEGKP